MLLVLFIYSLSTNFVTTMFVIDIIIVRIITILYLFI